MLAAAISAGLLLVAGCSGDTGESDPPATTGSPNDSPTDFSPAETEVVDAAVGTQPDEQPRELEDPPALTEPQEPDDTPADPVPDGGDPDLNPADDSGVPPPVPDVILTQPKVVLSEGHKKLCVGGVGDSMPSITLPDTAGNAQSLASLSGRKLTAVVFWRLDHPYAREQFERLEREVAGPFGVHGVNVVAINVGDPADAVQAAGQQPDAAFPMLLDTDGAALATVGTGKLPRTYLLNPAGEILWFDIEYSESTRRQLKNAILWHLTHDPAVASRAARPR